MVVDLLHVLEFDYMTLKFLLDWAFDEAIDPRKVVIFLEKDLLRVLLAVEGLLKVRLKS